MTRSSRLALTTRALALVCAALFVSATLGGATETADLGSIDFPNSGKAAVLEHSLAALIAEVLLGLGLDPGFEG